MSSKTLSYFYYRVYAHVVSTKNKFSGINFRLENIFKYVSISLIIKLSVGTPALQHSNKNML